MNKYDNSNDEVDLRKLILTLWQNKLIIIICVIIFVSVASLNLRSTERKYSFSYKLKPVAETVQSPTLARFGNIASLAGIQLPSASGNDFKIFKELLTSVEVAEKVFEDKKLIMKLFEYEWDILLNNYSAPKTNKINNVIGKIKRFLTGSKEIAYTPPNPKRLVEFLKANVTIVEDKQTGFLYLKGQNSKPQNIIELIISTVEVSDKIMRERYIVFSSEPLAFYKEKLATARSREHREALAQLISKEEQKLMLASSSKYFVAEPILNPTISMNPTYPNSQLNLLLSLVIGLTFGSIIVFIKNLKNER